MTEQDIKIYLRDTTSLSEDQLELVAYQVRRRLNYGPIYDQIDQLKEEFIDSWLTLTWI